MLKTIVWSTILFGLWILLMQESHPFISETEAKTFLKKLGYSNILLNEDSLDLSGNYCSGRYRYYAFSAKNAKGYVCTDEHGKPFLMLF